GENVVTAAMSDLSHGALVRQIVGSDVAVSSPNARESDAAGSRAEPKLIVHDLTTMAMTKPISFHVHAGEILGICGLVGSGTRELAQALGGSDLPTGGRVLLAG